MKEGEKKVCEACGQSPAVLHLTRVVDSQTTTYHLCEECAAEKGLEAPAAPSNLLLADFLAKMGNDEVSEASDPSSDLSCPFCGMTTAAFKDLGRLGCPQCYTTFDGSLKSLLRRIHGGTQHVGKVYLPPDPSSTEVEQRLHGLKKKLQRAVDTEDFERAAELRDEIRTLEPAS